MENKSEKQSADGYEELFIAFGRKVERAIAAVLIVLLFSLAVSQLLLQFPRMRYLMVKVEQLEGNHYDSPIVFKAGD